MRIYLILLMFLISISTLYGCGDDFEPAGKLGQEPRIIGITATPPEGMPQSDATLTLTLHDPQKVYNTCWVRCLPYPGEPVEQCISTRMDFLGIDKPQPCTPDAFQPCIEGTGDSIKVTLPNIPEDKDQFTIYYYGLTAPTTNPLSECSGFFHDPPIPDDNCLIGIKRIVVSKNPKNKNPKIWKMLINGLPVENSTTLNKNKKYTIEPAPLASSLDELSPDEPMFYPIEFFSDCGELSFYHQNLKCIFNELNAIECSYEPPILKFYDSINQCKIYTIMKDNLGGENIYTLSISLQN